MRANYQVNATPQFRVLSDDQIQEIFHAALEVMRCVGTRVYGAEGIALLREAGCWLPDSHDDQHYRQSKVDDHGGSHLIGPEGDQHRREAHL